MADEMKMAAGEPVDPATGSSVAQRTSRVAEMRLLLVIAAGGVIGGLSRYWAGLWWPTAVGRFPWTTLSINALGCALIGVLVVLVSDVFTGRKLVRPFLGTGVLGGFTTFSTYAMDSERLMATGHVGPGLLNLAGTVVVAMAAVTAGTRLTRRAVALTSGGGR